MSAGWIIKRNNKENGPFTSQQLKKLATTGKLKPTDLIRKTTGGKFTRADAVKGLFPEEEIAEEDSAEFANVDISRYGDLPMEEDEPRSRRSGSATKTPPRAGGKRKGKKAGPKGKGKSRKKDEDDWEDDPINDMFWGTTLVGFGVGTIFYNDPEVYELPEFVVTIHEYSGRFGVAAFLLVLSLIFFVPAIQKIQRLKAKGKNIPWHLPALGWLLAGLLSASDEGEEE